ncbi:alpha/beta fold hydrolase [Actinokineospora iranica]|uniref:Pimeloyl-ACP methyl ester carboxylesterase n=1 Tax=Actinokineospora iranica TaxID=1271860 RepID=A0A1G6R437_9PSEU|nr:alpha/beta fold hydrolase [Actinokineospora iranica]SDC99064.1 Pimeloyl-ACP methyl ester carboxylesterase [Actinokineospora iranica]
MADYFRTSDGVALNVVVTGAADAPVTVLMTHGWTSDLRIWDEVAAAIGDRVRVIRFDHRGHGGSGAAPKGSATLGRLGDDLAELITARVPTGALVLVGHSMGGMAMMALAERHPRLVAERVGAAVFTSTSAGRMGEVTFGLPKPLVKLALQAQKRGKKKPAATHTAPRPPRPVEPPSRLKTLGQLAFLRWLLFGTRFRMIDVRSAADQLARSHRSSAGSLRRDIVGKHSRSAALAAYSQIPTQVLVGDRDRLTPLDHAEEIAKALPDAEFVIYRSAGHMLPYERVPEVTARIMDMVERASGHPVELAS